MIKRIFVMFIVFFSAYSLALPEQQGKITFLQIHQNPSDNDENSPRYIVKIGATTISQNNCGANQRDDIGHPPVYFSIRSGCPIFETFFSKGKYYEI